MNKTLVMILAGGEGKRLYPLTKDRAKPAVPFGGRYRIIDFVINNFINSGFYKIKVLTQYKSDSLNKHITRGWPLSPIVNHFIDLLPAQMRTGGGWYKGTADAIYQNINSIEDENAKYVCVFGGDHVYKMNVAQMLDFHKEKQAGLTISAIPIPIIEANQFGIMEINKMSRLISFKEKPLENIATIPDNPDFALASMGNYIFDKDVLVDILLEDAKDENSSHDFGKDIIPKLLNKVPIYVYDFSKNTHPGMLPTEHGYWRDVGNVDAYFQANMDLLEYEPEFNLDNGDWPMRTFNYNFPPAKFTSVDDNAIGFAKNSLISEGCEIHGATVEGCILSPNVKISKYSKIKDSIIMEDVEIGEHVEISNAIIDKVVKIPNYAKIGLDKKEDISRGFYVSPDGVTVIPKGAKLYV